MRNRRKETKERSNGEDGEVTSYGERGTEQQESCDTSPVLRKEEARGNISLQIKRPRDLEPCCLSSA